MTIAMALASGSVAAVQLLSVDDEIRIGRDAQRDLLRELPQVPDASVRAYVASIGRELAGFASGAPYPYSFSTADYRELNAFAVPGGPVWINRGVLEAADTEDQVAGVLAHEIAHVAGRHSARQATKGLWTSGLLWVLGAAVGESDDWRAQAVGLGAAVAAGSVMLKFSRNDEKAADRDAVRILTDAGRDPHGLLEFMERLDAEQARAPSSVARFFSTHPAPRDRVRALTALVGDGPALTRGEPAEFLRMRRRLSQLPPARSMPQ